MIFICIRTLSDTDDTTTVYRALRIPSWQIGVVMLVDQQFVFLPVYILSVFFNNIIFPALSSGYDTIFKNRKEILEFYKKNVSKKRRNRPQDI